MTDDLATLRADYLYRYGDTHPVCALVDRVQAAEAALAACEARLERADSDRIFIGERAEALFGGSPAKRLFDSRSVAGQIEDEVFSALLTACDVDPENPTAWPVADFTFDYYDESFEFKGCREDWCPTTEQLAKCWALGFDRCWICYGERGKEGYHEKAFASARAPLP